LDYLRNSFARFLLDFGGESMKKANDSDDQRRRFDEDAAELLNKIFRLIYRRTLDKELASDIAQEAVYRFLRNMTARNWSTDIKSFEAFLIRTALNLLTDRWREKGKVQFVSLDGDFDRKLQEEVDRALGQNDGVAVFDDGREKEMLLDEMLRKILDGLSEYDKYLLRLHRVEDLSPKEIAELTGKDVYWVRYQLTKIEARIRQRARQYLKASGKKSFF
jgi:RNA polymerase sigma factor (sigma-70 family)